MADVILNKWTLNQQSASQHCHHCQTDVGMHDLLASQSCYHSVLPPCLCTLLASPFNFTRNLFAGICYLALADFQIDNSPNLSTCQYF